MLHYADSLFKAQKYKSPYITAGHYMAYSNYYDLHILPLKALRYTDSAIAIIDRQNLDDSLWVRYYFAAHVKKAHTLFETGQYTQSIDEYFKIKEIADRPANKCSIGVGLYNNIGLVLFKQQNYARAQQYFAQALRILDDCPAGSDKSKKQELLGNVGESFANENKPDSALRYYHQALQTIENTKFSEDPNQDKIARAVSKAVMVSNIARIFVKENKLDSAELYFKEDIAINALSYNNEIRNGQESELNLAELYNSERNYPKMKHVLDELRRSLDSIRNDEIEPGWRKLKAEYDGKNGSPALALVDYQKYVSIKDSLDNVKALVSQSDINRELTVKQEQMNNVVLTQDNKLSHLYLWITIALSLMAIAILGLIYYYYKRGKKNIQALTLLNREIGEQRDKLEFAMLELEKSNRGKERILKVVAHDLRNPISGIATLAGSVINRNMPKKDERQSLALIEKASSNSLALINELLELDLGQKQLKLDKNATDIVEIIKHCVALIQLNADKKNQKLLLSAPQGPLMMNIDKDRIERMINNLLGNAVKFSRLGEKIIVELQQKEKAVLIVIKDNGIGIPAEMQDEIFNIFSGTRRNGTAGEKSFGLGLSICKQIADAHGGAIWADSENDAGSTFYAELPL